MKYRNDLKRRVLEGLFAGATLCLAAPAVLAAGSPVPNTQLPGDILHSVGGVTVDRGNGILNVHQDNQNAVIKWDSFNVGANATVNFDRHNGQSFNTLNYVNSANGMSQIYGSINAKNGNIYIVNPAGVEIGNSAQINVGSLYVSNRNLDDFIKENMTAPEDMAAFIQLGTTTDAVLMSLGNVNASNVTFDGGRIVIDAERLKDAGGDAKLAADKITVRTNDAANVVIGYDAYDEIFKKDDQLGTYAGKDKDVTDLAQVLVNGKEIEKGSLNAYMWVEDVEQLQAIDTNLSGSYALRNSIDATATQDWTGSFNPLGGTGQNGDDNPFTGKFDGLDYNIFNLNINRDTDNVGLFGVVGGSAVINNVTLVGGSITGKNNVGALAGSVQDGTHISNITNSASVTGASNVGGIVGESIGTEENRTVYDGLINTGTITSSGADDENGGQISNAGGLIGYLEKGDLGGTSYNLGAVTGRTEADGTMTVGYNVGGLVGHAVSATLGDVTNLIYNRLNVTGAYNVGGIVGAMEGTTVQNAENSGNVLAIRYTTGDYKYHSAHYANNGIYTVTDVYYANVGGIAGSASATEGNKSLISGVLNTGDVSSATATGQEMVTEDGENYTYTYTYYNAGNVGGVVGSAVDTNITDATNRENEIRGAHNVGGVAGYFSGEGKIEKGVNDGGDILATGARNDSGFVKEWVRLGDTGGEEAIIGNMGGIVGYMDGDNVFVTGSANRGTVHSQDITGTTVLSVSQAANAGGIVGKIDRSKTETLDNVKSDVTAAAVSNSYSTGDVRGYMGVGGIAGMMYNGEIAGSYNLGTVNTTRNRASFKNGSFYSVNMGGIVGDTTEQTNASALLYDVYNKGQIGDETFTYYARHVGGIVGRLSGTVEKAYNTGAIYNGYNVVGGIVGWMYKGSINNAFNTGNITVNNQENGAAGIQAGGIAGGATTGAVTISNVYNLGTIRGYQDHGAKNDSYAVGGIVGAFIGSGNQSISNAYTTGNLYLNVGGQSSTSGLGSIYGLSETHRPHMTLINTYYIKPDEKIKDSNGNSVFTDLSGTDKDNSNKAIEFDKKDVITEYAHDGYKLFQDITESGKVNDKDAWRIYAGSTPILNAFLPNAKDYFDNPITSQNGIGSIQYGTAYDPLLTIVNAADGAANLTFDWQDLGINNDAGLAVYGAGLTLNDFMATGGSGYFGGLIYSDGALTINADTKGENPHGITGNVALGSASQLYGSSVAINADGQVTIYGSVTATGNGTTAENHPDEDKSGSISIVGGSVDIYGQLTSAEENKKVFVPGIHGIAEDWTPGTVSDPHVSMSDIGDRFGYTTGASAVNGNISITANDAADGHVNVYYGNKGEGLVTTAGDLTVTASGDIYMDSDLSIGGDLSLNAGYKEGESTPAADSEAVLDISNIGKVQAEKGTVTDALEGLHNFLNQFSQQGENAPFIKLDGGETKIAVDMRGTDSFNLTKYDYKGKTLANRINDLNLSVNGNDEASGQDYTYIWVSTGEQLAGIQQYYEQETDAGRTTNILSYNFALKNDIDASDVTNYQAIGTGSAYTGIFDGRDNRIIGLDTTKISDDSGQTLTNAGIFDTIGENGKVEDLRVYSGTFSGTDNAGAVAGVNHGNISNVTAFGNVVTAQGSVGSTELDNQLIGAAGGITGVNYGKIDNASAIGTATAANAADESGALSTAGGIVGINQAGAEISDSTSNSAVDASAESTYALGGVVGVNAGKLENVDSLGVTTGVYKGNTMQYSDNVGGIAGINQTGGTVENVYNESIVSGRDNVGGILGVNHAAVEEGKDSLVSNVANASSVTGEADSFSDTNNTSDYIGGLVGNNEGSITNGRNNGEITGNNYVGGLVGANGEHSTLTNLVNDESASIIGDNYVGGIAGSNAGTISADEDNDNLINRGTITGQMYVGGVAGENTGTIANTHNDVELHVRYDVTETTPAKYFGGVAGINGHLNEGGTVSNPGTITSATNTNDIIAPEADYVGGIVGWNPEGATLNGMGNSNEGRVEGASHVGGVAGLNNAAITGSLNDMSALKIPASSLLITAVQAASSGKIPERLSMWR